MPDLTKKESMYFITFALAALTLIIVTLALWAQTQPNCWDRYKTEEIAIRECEKVSS